MTVSGKEIEAVIAEALTLWVAPGNTVPLDKLLSKSLFQLLKKED